MTTAFVLSGGASLGAVQVGMLQALAERDIVPDLLVGTSSGALNSAYLAGHGFGIDQSEELAAIWRSLRTWQLFRPDPRRGMGALLGHTTSFFSNRGTTDLLARHLNFAQLQDAKIPLTVVATDLQSGAEVAISSGPAAPAILASIAIPGLLPPVEWHDRTLVDGGLADDAAISQAVSAGADRIYVLPCGYPCALDETPRSALAILAHAMAVMVHERLLRDIQFYADRVDLIVLPPPCPMSVNPLDFSRADHLITRSHEAAVKHLSIKGGRRKDPARLIGIHTHHRKAPS